MLKIQRFVFNMFAENTYVISDETKECIFLDCGAFYSEERAAVRRYIETENLKPTHLICTHGHLDHVLGNGFLYHMVRNIIGTVANVGLGRISVERFAEIMESLDRHQASATAPACGLYLYRVEY